MDELLSLPFDQYQRYRLVADLVERVRPANRALRILDVGGRTALLRKFLPDDSVELVDVESSEEPGLVLGSGGALPFQDGSFDVVAAFDTLEHVPPKSRRAFVTECARVASRHVILAGPYKSPRVDEAEEILVDFMADKLGVKHRYLAEHRDNGLPVRAKVEEWLEKVGGRVKSVGHANLDRWLVLMCLELYLDHDPLLRGLAQRFFQFYNSSMYSSDHGGVVYRHAVIASIGRSREPDVEGLFDAPEAPPGATQALLQMGLGVIAFEGDRDAWKPEIKRLEKIVRSLEKNLSGHKKRLGDTTKNLQEHKAALRAERKRGKLEAQGQAKILRVQARDLKGHKKTLQKLEPELELQVQAGQELQRDLEGHRAKQVELLLGLEAQEAAIDDLLEKLTKSEDVRAQEAEAQELARETLNKDLEGHRAETEAARGRIDDLLETVTDLRNSLQELEEVRDQEALAQEEARTVLADDLEGHKAENKAARDRIDELYETVTDLRGSLKESEEVRDQEAVAQEEARTVLLADLDGHREERAAAEVRIEELLGVAKALKKDLNDSQEHRTQEATAQGAVVAELEALTLARGELIVELESFLEGHQKEAIKLSELLELEQSGRKEVVASLGKELEALAEDRASVLASLDQAQAGIASLESALGGAQAEARDLADSLDGQRIKVQQSDARSKAQGLELDELRQDFGAVDAHRTEVLGLLAETQAGAESLEAALNQSQGRVVQQEAEIDRLRGLVGSRLESLKLVFRPERRKSAAGAREAEGAESGSD